MFLKQADIDLKTITSGQYISEKRAKQTKKQPDVSIFAVTGGRTRLIEGAPLTCAVDDMQMSLTNKRAFCTVPGGR